MDCFDLTRLCCNTNQFEYRKGETLYVGEQVSASSNSVRVLFSSMHFVEKFVPVFFAEAVVVVVVVVVVFNIDVCTLQLDVSLLCIIIALCS